ncbi:MAG: serine/threonine-protein kinase [Polyangiaceae bacterium]
MGDSGSTPMRVVGRYALYAEIAAGGMATVHFGRLLGPVGFSRTVAIKRLHPQFAKDPEFVSMFLDEARLAARIRHPNVVPTLDVVATNGELFLVMDYVQGESLSRLVRVTRERRSRIPPRVVASIMSGALHGLHAAHEARNERGEPLGIVHRDISPQNVLVGTDGVARVLDFGVAKAAGRIQTTREGQLKGKLSYMAPEQLSGAVTRQTDIYAAAIVLWEALTAKRLFAGDNEAAILGKVLTQVVEPPSKYMTDVSATIDTATMRGYELIDAVTLRGLERDPTKRFATAREMAIALERCIGLASPSDVGEWVELYASDVLHRRAEKIAEIESTSSVNVISHARDLASEMNDPRPNRGGEMGHEMRTLDASIVPPPSLPKGPDNSNSQLSSISLSRSGEPPPVDPMRRPLGIIVGILALIVAMLAVFAGVLVIKSGPSAPSVAAGSPSPTAPPPAMTSSAPAAVPVVVADVPDAAVAAPLPAPVAAVVSAPARPTRPRPPSTSPTPKAKDCDPPYTLDSNGRKHYKVECL